MVVVQAAEGEYEAEEDKAPANDSKASLLLCHQLRTRGISLLSLQYQSLGLIYHIFQHFITAHINPCTFRCPHVSI